MSEPERWAVTAILGFAGLNCLRLARDFVADAFAPKSRLLPTHIAQRLGVFGGFLALAACACGAWWGTPWDPFGKRLAALGFLAWVLAANLGLLVWAVG